MSVRLHEGGAAEQVPHLYEHEREKEEIKRAEHDDQLGRAEGRRRRRPRQHLWRDQSLLLAIRGEVAEQARAEPCDSRDDHDVRPGARERHRHRGGDEPFEDRVRSDEEPAEQNDERRPDGEPAADCGHLLVSQPAGRVKPWDISPQQVDSACERPRSRSRQTGGVVADPCVLRTRLRSAQRTERDGSRQREDIRGRQEW